jgi:septal ring factor EnvC (AmiA/AmiB activator)
MDEVDSQAEPTFETKNYLFELQSKCNNLEYEKAKITMTHQNMLSELRHKNIHLEQLAGNLSQQNELLAEERDNLKQVLGEVREQNHELSKEINLLRV